MRKESHYLRLDQLQGNKSSSRMYPQRLKPTILKSGILEGGDSSLPKSYHFSSDEIMKLKEFYNRVLQNQELSKKFYDSLTLNQGLAIQRSSVPDFLPLLRLQTARNVNSSQDFSIHRVLWRRQGR